MEGREELLSMPSSSHTEILVFIKGENLPRKVSSTGIFQPRNAQEVNQFGRFLKLDTKMKLLDLRLINTGELKKCDKKLADLLKNVEEIENFWLDSFQDLSEDCFYTLSCIQIGAILVEPTIQTGRIPSFECHKWIISSWASAWNKNVVASLLLQNMPLPSASCLRIASEHLDSTFMSICKHLVDKRNDNVATLRNVSWKNIHTRQCLLKKEADPQMLEFSFSHPGCFNEVPQCRVSDHQVTLSGQGSRGHFTIMLELITSIRCKLEASATLAGRVCVEINFATGSCALWQTYSFSWKVTGDIQEADSVYPLDLIFVQPQEDLAPLRELFEMDSSVLRSNLHSIAKLVVEDCTPTASLDAYLNKKARYIREEENKRHIHTENRKPARLWPTGIIHDILSHSEEDIYNYPVRVCLLDTGCDVSHTEFEDAHFEALYHLGEWNPQTGLSSEDYQLVLFDEEEEEKPGHGTACASVLAGKTCGITPYVTLLVGKLQPDDVNSIIRGLDWACAKKADVISLSLGRSRYDYKLSSAIQKALALGIVITVSSSNDGAKHRMPIDFPACTGGLICVGSHNDSGHASAFTGIGRDLDFLAPGEDITVACCDTLNFASSNGCSVATPFVAGLVALIIGHLKKKGLARSFYDSNTNETLPVIHTDIIRGILQIIARSSDHDVSRGYGRLDVKKFFWEKRHPTKGNEAIQFIHPKIEEVLAQFLV